LISDLISWIELHLVRTERLVLGRSGAPQCVREHDVGVVRLEPVSLEKGSKFRIASPSQVQHLLGVSRERVLTALCAAIENREMAFANGALFGSRVIRDKGADGRAMWRVRLTEEMALSDQVLALFGADALEHPLVYENDLAVCEMCGAVSLNPTRPGSRRGCASHPFGGCDSQKSRVATPPYGFSLRGRTSA